MKRHMKSFISYLAAFAVLFTSVIPASAYTKPQDAEPQLQSGYAASPDAYEIFPVPQSIVYDGAGNGTEFQIGEEVNIVWEDGIDAYTQNFLKEILGNYGRTFTVSDAEADGKTNILLGVRGSGKAADQYADENVTVRTEGLLDETDSYLLSARGSGAEGTILILGRDTNAVYYGLATLQMMFSSFAGEKFLSAQIEDYASMASRGFIEGFYGGWNYEGRESLMRFARDYKMNTYVYASKTDKYHSGEFSLTPYPAADIDNIKKLVQVGKETKVEYAWSVHLSYFFQLLNGYTVGSSEYNAKFQENYDKLTAKFQQLYDVGVRKFDVLNDDFGGGSLEEVVRLLNKLDQEFIQEKGCRRMSYCPQGYNKAWGLGGYGQNGKEFESLKELNAAIDIYWTGDDVNSPITQETVSFLKDRTGHDPVFWLNYPVNEHGASGVYLGDITHYARSSVQGLAGAVSNPSRFTEANKVGLFQLAALFWNNSDYESHARQLWEASFKYLQPEVYDAYFTIARNVANCPKSGRVPEGFSESEYLAEKLDSVAAKIVNGASLDGDSEAAELIEEFEHILSSIQVFRSQCVNPTLVQELDPWLRSLNDIAEGGKAALLSVRAFRIGDTEEAFSQFAAAAKAMETQASYPTFAGSDKMALAGSKHLEPFVTKVVSEAKKMLVPYLNPNPSDFSMSFYGVLAGTEKSDDAQSAKIFDGNAETYAEYQVVQQLGDYFGVDLGKVVPVQSIDILQGKTDADHDYFHNGCLEYSQDGTSWTTIAPNVDTHKLGIRNINIKARYIRLRLTAVGTPSKKDYWTFIREFTVNGPKGSSYGAYTNVEELASAPVTKEDRSYHMADAAGVRLTPGEYIGIKMSGLVPVEKVSYEAGEAQDKLTVMYSQDAVGWVDSPEAVEGGQVRYVYLLNGTDQTLTFDLNAFDITTGDYTISPSVTESSYANLKEGNWNNLFDGDDSTYALTNTAQKKDHAIIVDLGATVPVYDVKVTTGDEDPRFYDAKFQISEDKSSWEDFAEVTDGAGDVVKDNIFYHITKNLDGKMGRYIRILVTKDNENALMINELEVNKTRHMDMPELTGTLSGGLEKMIDGNIASVYTSAVPSDGGDYLKYKLTENTRLEKLTVLQDPNAVSNAAVSVFTYNKQNAKGTGIEENEVGALSAGINTFTFDGEKDILSIKITWPEGTTPTIYEIMPVSKGDAGESGEETTFTQDGKQVYKLSAENYNAVTVEYDTSFGDIPLPDSMTVTYQDSSTEDTGIDWMSKGYNPRKAGTYTWKGYPRLPDGSYNHAGLYADVQVTVRENQGESDDDKYPDVDNGSLVLNGQVEESGAGLYPASEAVDGDINTRWEGSSIKGGAPATTSWILADLGGKDISVTRMNVKFYLKTYATNYEIQESDNKKDWRTVETKTNPNGDSKDIIDSFTFDTPITKRYVRLLFNSMNVNALGHAVGIREWEVIGSRRAVSPEPECTCQISGLKLDGQNVLTPAGQQSVDIPLDAAAQVIGGCKVAGHDKLSISYLYAITADTTQGAVLDKDKLTVSDSGDVTIQVTASLSGSGAKAVRAEAVFHVTKEALPPVQSYTASFTGGGGTAGTGPKDITAKAGSQFELPANPYVKAGYHFTGWSDGVRTYQPSDRYTVPEHNVSFMARWEKDQTEPPRPVVYKLNLNANGGTVKTASKEVTEDAALGTLPVPERKGHTFLGWFTQAEGGLQLTEKSIFTFKKDTTVYAHWKTNQTEPPRPVVREPARPAELKAVYNKDKTIKLGWKKVQGAKGYILSRYDSKTKKWSDVKETSSTSYKNTGLKPASIYKYRVKAYNQSGSVIKEGRFSRILTTATAPVKTKLAAKRYGTSKVKLTWNRKAKADGFEIYMRTGRKSYGRIARKGKKGTVYIKSKLKKGTAYTFKLRSYKKVGKIKVYSAYTKTGTIRMK